MKASMRILEKSANAKGDLFGRLVSDLFIAIGYHAPQCNIAKSGREIDLRAEHRLEPHVMVAECKATADPVGGDDINKFVGALDAERVKAASIRGYFISLSGFRGSALEQESAGRATRVTLLDAQAIIRELVTGRVLIPVERAAAIAGQLSGLEQGSELEEVAEVLVHRRGWMWAIYFHKGRKRTHFALIHSDGTPLADVVATEVVRSDSLVRGSLSQLTRLRRADEEEGGVAKRLAARQAWTRDIEIECGEVQLDGLPADGEVGTRRLKLESLFVPMHLEIKSDAEVLPGNDEVVERLSVGEALRRHKRLAVLSPPGGGKTTLLKQLAVAYADPARRDGFDSSLPPEDLVPLVIRCRELREKSRAPFSEMLGAISERELIRAHARPFRDLVDQLLEDGKILLLVDGLDEIADSGDRAVFVSTLRSVMRAYPDTWCVVTSRTAGFRHVASQLLGVCKQAQVAEFNRQDINRLCVAWYREVVGETERSKKDAETLASTICSVERIYLLARNPLMLTTLLLVKRWVGSLPTRRVILYGKAVEVLLMTWNTEGFAPIPEEEAMPQLGYVAAYMMQSGVQRIGRRELADALRRARIALPQELGYVKETVDSFIGRVESRSSLIMMAGMEVVDGKLEDMFEFRHLTFQEYMAAVAMVKGWVPGEPEGEELADVLAKRWEADSWREVVPLATSMAGKAADRVVRVLAEEVGKGRVGSTASKTLSVILAQCLADEVGIRPDTVSLAAKAIVLSELCNMRAAPVAPALVQLMAGKYAPFMVEAARKELDGIDDVRSINAGAKSLAAIIEALYRGERGVRAEVGSEECRKLLLSDSIASKCEGAIGVMHAFYVRATRRETMPKVGSDALQYAAELIFLERPIAQFCGAWAIAWAAEAGECGVVTPRLSDRLGDLCWDSWIADVRRQAGWALGNMRIVSGASRHARDPMEVPSSLWLRRSGASGRMEFSGLSRAKPVAATALWAWIGGHATLGEIVAFLESALTRSDLGLRGFQLEIQELIAALKGAEVTDSLSAPAPAPAPRTAP